MTYRISLFWYSLFFCRFTLEFRSGWPPFIYVINQGPLSAMNHDHWLFSKPKEKKDTLLFVLMNNLHHERSLPNETSTAHSCLADHPSRHAPSLVHLLIKTLRSKRILIDTCEAVRGRLLPLALTSNSGFFCASSFSWRWWMTVLLPSWEVSRQPVWLTVFFFESKYLQHRWTSLV